MNNQQIVLIYLILAITTLLFKWPAGLLVLFIISHANGDLPR